MARPRRVPAGSPPATKSPRVFPCHVFIVLSSCGCCGLSLVSRRWRSGRLSMILPSPMHSTFTGIFAKKTVKKTRPMTSPSRDCRQRTFRGASDCKMDRPLSLMLIQGGDDTCRCKKVTNPPKNGGSLASLYFFPDSVKNRTCQSEKVASDSRLRRCSLPLSI